jgi:hypothetical protein
MRLLRRAPRVIGGCGSAACEVQTESVLERHASKKEQDANQLVVEESAPKHRCGLPGSTPSDRQRSEGIGVVLTSTMLLAAHDARSGEKRMRSIAKQD